MRRIILVISLLFVTVWADDPKAREIMEKVDARYDGNTVYQDMIIILIDKNKNK